MDTPILIIAHQRPQLLERCLNRLAESGFKNLYASIDGCTDQESHGKVKLLLEQKIPSGKLQICKEHLGCEKGVLAGIDWFFDHVDKGIIVEEDVLISDTGLNFLTDMLNEYQDVPRVFMAGAHLPTQTWQTGHGHFFSRIGHIWGWATWKDRWEKHDRTGAKQLLNTSILQDHFGQTRLTDHFQSNLSECVEGKLDTWDFQFNHSMLNNNGVCALPATNQVQNIGISPDALHTTDLHEGICNTFQPFEKGTAPSDIRPQRQYEHEWFRRLKGEVEQLSNRPDHDATQLPTPPKVTLINTTDIGGGAERICFDQLNFSEVATNLLVTYKKSEHDKVSDIKVKEGLLQKFLPSKIKLLEETEFADLVHLHNIHGMNLGWKDLTQLANKKPIVWTLHDQWILGKNDSAPFNEGDIPVGKLAFIKHPNVHLATPSLWLQDKVYWKTRKLPSLVKYGIDTNIFKPINKDQASKICGLDPTRKRILFLAKNPETNPYKDLVSLKTAWLNANEILIDKGFDLYCLGGTPKSEIHGKYRFEVIAPTQKATEVAAWINACDISVNATLNDNSPVSIIEALACKVPVLGTNVGGINELLESGKAGQLVGKQSPSDIENAILETQSNSGRIQQMVENGFARVQRDHTIEKMCDAYLGLYSKVS